MEIKILGGGCSRCERLEALTRQAATELGLTPTFTKVKDMAAIAEYDISGTPALVINEQVKASGRIPRVDEIKGWLQAIAA